MAKILVADDQRLFLKVIESILVKQGYEVVTAASGEEALEQLNKEKFNLLISDIRMEPLDGMELLKKIKAQDKDLCVIMLTGCDEIDIALRAMKLGAFDYLTKPLKLDDLTKTVHRAFQYTSITGMRFVKVKLKREQQDNSLHGIVARSPRMTEVCSQIKQFAPTQQPVLLRGEPDAGVELVARNIHRYSTRKDKPFIKIDCAEISQGLLEESLFGKGENSPENLFRVPFLGTVFIHEIEKLPLPVQDRILKALDRQAESAGSSQNVRLLYSSTSNLMKKVESGAFRKEFYNRISLLTINIPPLRERKEDIIPLMTYIIFKKLRKHREMPMLNNEAEELLLHYAWPGNVTELVYTVQYALSNLENNTITKEALPDYLSEVASSSYEAHKALGQTESLKGKSLKAFLHAENGPIKTALKKKTAQTKAPKPQKIVIHKSPKNHESTTETNGAPPL